ncbi:MAG: uroporphyrinogen-III synthase [Chloroflexota bacterium]
MTLIGKRIVITRAEHQADELTCLIEQAGGIPILYPCIEIMPPDNTVALDSALRHLSVYDTVIFTSSNTVFSVAERLANLDIVFDWRTIRIIAVGDKTDALIQSTFNGEADFIPSHYTASTLADELPIQHGEKILLPLSALSDGELTDLLTARGAEVTTVEAYQTVIGTGGEDVPALLRENKIDAITFTSGSTVTNFVKRIAPETAYDIPAVCIGPSTHAVAMDAGFTNVVYPENYTLIDMLHLLSGLFNEVQYGNT